MMKKDTTMKGSYLLVVIPYHEEGWAHKKNLVGDEHGAIQKIEIPDQYYDLEINQTQRRYHLLTCAGRTK